MMLNENESVTEINFGLSLIQDSLGLTYGTDAFLLSAFIRKMPKASAVEFGSGTGVISLLCAAKKKFGSITAIECQQSFCGILKRNIELNGLSEIITAVNGDIRDYRAKADAVFTNPPYMKCGHGKPNEYMGKYIARHEVCGSIYDFCKSAASCLKFGGLFYCVYRPDRITDLICAMRENNIEPKRITMIYPDAQHQPCLMLTEGKYGGKSSAILTKPLIMYKSGTNDPTPELEKIYETGDMQ